MKKIIKVLLCAVSVIFVSGCNKQEGSITSTTRPLYTGQASKEEAEELAGFTIELPETIPQAEILDYAARRDALIQAIYGTGTTGVDRIDKAAIYKANNDSLFIIQLDIETYPQVETFDLSDIEESGVTEECIVTVRGKDDLKYLAVWENDGYWYRIRINEEVGMSISLEDMKDIVTKVK